MFDTRNTNEMAPLKKKEVKRQKRRRRRRERRRRRHEEEEKNVKENFWSTVLGNNSLEKIEHTLCKY